MKGRKSTARAASSHYRVLEDAPEIGLREGDTISHDPGDDASPFLIIRTADLTPEMLERGLAFGVFSEIDAAPASAPAAKPRPAFLALVK